MPICLLMFGADVSAVWAVGVETVVRTLVGGGGGGGGGNAPHNMALKDWVGGWDGMGMRDAGGGPATALTVPTAFMKGALMVKLVGLYVPRMSFALIDRLPTLSLVPLDNTVFAPEMLRSLSAPRLP